MILFPRALIGKASAIEEAWTDSCTCKVHGPASQEDQRRGFRGMSEPNRRSLNDAAQHAVQRVDAVVKELTRLFSQGSACYVEN